MSARGDIEVDGALWPLLVVRFSGVPTTPQVEDYLARMTEFLERGETYVTLFDSSGMTGMGPAEQRHLQANWMKRNAARLKELSQGNAFVINSPLVRLAVSVVFHLTSMRSPYVITGRLDEAVAWATNRLEECGQGAAAQRAREHFGLGASRSSG